MTSRRQPHKDVRENAPSRRQKSLQKPKNGNLVGTLEGKRRRLWLDTRGRLAGLGKELGFDSCYKKKPFENDEQRLKHLFKMYELMTSGAKDEDLEQLELL